MAEKELSKGQYLEVETMIDKSLVEIKKQLNKITYLLIVITVTGIFSILKTVPFDKLDHILDFVKIFAMK